MIEQIAGLPVTPTWVASLPPEDVPKLLATVEHLRALLWQRLLQPAHDPPRPDDRLLRAREAAEILGTTPDWLRRHTTLPFVVRLSEGQVRYSARGIQHFISRPP